MGSNRYPIRRRVAGAVRYLRLDHNPLRRRIDHVHVLLIVALLTSFALAGPLAAVLSARLSYEAGVHAEHRDSRTRHLVAAMVVATERPDAPVTALRWWTSGGTTRTGYLPRDKNDRPGARRDVWIDRAGDLTAPPRSHTQTVYEAVLAPLTAVPALIVVLAACYVLANRRLECRRMELWEREWRTVAERWTGRR